MKSKLLTLMIVFVVFLASGCDKTPLTTNPNTSNNGTTSSSVTNTVKDKEKTKKVVLYRVPADGTQTLFAETKEIKIEKNNLALSLAKALIEGESKKTSPDCLAVFPKGTKVLNVSVKDSLASVNLSKEFLEKNVGDYVQVMMVNAIVNTLTELPEIKKVEFLVEGKKVEVLGQLDLDKPLTRNESMLSKKK